MTMLGMAQNPVIDELMDKFSGKPGFTTVEVSKRMFTLFADVSSDEEMSAFKELVENLDGIQVISADSTVVKGFKAIATVGLNPKGYEELLTVRESGKRVEILIKEKGDIIEEVLVIALEENEASLISITGRINLKQIAELGKKLKIDGLENLENVDR